MLSTRETFMEDWKLNISVRDVHFLWLMHRRIQVSLPTSLSWTLSLVTFHLILIAAFSCSRLVGKKRCQQVPKKGKEEEEEKDKGQSLGHDMHIWTERERRKKMRNMFSSVQALLPDLPSKVDKSTIVEEAVTYIKTLQVTVQRLEKQKLERLQGSNSLSSIAGSSKMAVLSSRETFIADQVSSISNNNNDLVMDKRTSGSHLLPAIIQTWSSANVVLNVCGDFAQFVVYAPKKQGFFANICSILDKHRLEAVSVHISSDANCCNYIFQARLADRAADEFPEVFSVEERYKHATGEMMTLISS